MLDYYGGDGGGISGSGSGGDGAGGGMVYPCMRRARHGPSARFPCMHRESSEETNGHVAFQIINVVSSFTHNVYDDHDLLQHFI